MRVTTETIITQIAEELGAENLMTKETAQKASKYLESEFQEWKGIVKRNPLQSAVAVGGVLVGLNLRFKNQISLTKLKTLFTRAARQSFPNGAESIAAKVLEVSTSNRKATSTKRRKSAPRTQSKRRKSA